MADLESASAGTPTARARSSSSLRSRDPHGDRNASERTPLLASTRDDVENDRPTSSSTERTGLLSSNAPDESKFLGGRWASLIAFLVLTFVASGIMAFRFIVPAVIEEYASQAIVFQPSKIAFDSVTATGIRAKVEFAVYFDASLVERFTVRHFGRIGTWVAHEVETTESRVDVFLPEFGSSPVGAAILPPMKADIRDKRVNEIVETVDLVPAAMEPLRLAAASYFGGGLKEVMVHGIAHIPVRSGIINLGNRTIAYSKTISATDVPSAPDYNITRLVVHDADLPDGNRGLEADVDITVHNSYPLDLTIPPLGFGILVDGCSPNDHIMIADAVSDHLHISPNADVPATGRGFIRRIPESLLNECPGTHKSPLDMIVGDYLHGAETTVYVRGSDSPDVDAPKWMTDLLSSVTVPVPFQGPEVGDLIRNFSLADVQFQLPDPGSDNDPEISANIEAIINIPDALGFTVNVSHVRALADVYWKEEKLGELNLREWQKAHSERLPESDDGGLLIQAYVEKAPLKITDEDLFTQLIATLLFKKRVAFLTIKADVDVKLETTLTPFTLREIPASGVFPVKPIDFGLGWASLAPQVGNITVLETTQKSIQFQALANFSNPTNYSATIPYFDVKVAVNGTILGHVTMESIEIQPGKNLGIAVRATYDPTTESGNPGAAIGRELISQFLSGYNTTITLKAHRDSIPSHPKIGEALSRIEIEFPTPRFGSDPNDGPDDDDDDGSGTAHFIKGATMHLWSSTAEFILLSPLASTTLFITRVNATAFYKREPVGHILHELPFAVEPGLSDTPRLPVDWKVGSVGYEALRKALGGTLRLHAHAEVGVRIGRWEEHVWYNGKGIGAKIRP